MGAFIGFDCINRLADGRLLPAADTVVRVRDQTANISKPDLITDSSGAIRSGTTDAPIGHVLIFSVGNSSITRIVADDLQTAQADALSLLIEDNLPAPTKFIKAVSAELWMRNLDTSEPPVFVADVLPGTTAQIPHSLADGLNLEFFLVSIGETGQRSASSLVDAERKTVSLSKSKLEKDSFINSGNRLLDTKVWDLSNDRLLLYTVPASKKLMLTGVLLFEPSGHIVKELSGFTLTLNKSNNSVFEINWDITELDGVNKIYLYTPTTGEIFAAGTILTLVSEATTNETVKVSVTGILL